MANPKSENYLDSFSTRELIEVVINSEDWHPADVKQAKSLLKKKGVTQKDLVAYRQRKVELELKGERANMGVLALGFVAALMGGFLGILIGYYLANSKKDSSQGKKVFTYDEPSRKFGWAILIVGLIGAIVWAILFFND